MSDDLERARQRNRERRGDEVMAFLGAEPVPDDYQPEDQSPVEHLRYSERKLWNECPEAHDALKRLGRYRASIERVERVCEASDTGHVSVVKVVAAIHGTGTQRP